MKLRRGFKAEAERISLEHREEMGLSVGDKLDPLHLAGRLELPVHPFSSLSVRVRDRNSIRKFIEDGSGELSAFTVFCGTRRTVFYNDSHPKTRSANDITHEIAHTLLFHPPHPLYCSDGGRIFDTELEDEATWLAAALLVPREGAFDLAAQGLDDDAIARNFGVSPSLATMRIRMTGIRTHLARLRN